MKNAEADTAATVGAQAGDVAPEKAPSKKGGTRRSGGPKGRTAAKGGQAKAGKKTGKSTQVKKSTPRAESKGAKIVELIRRPKGATLAELAKVSAWQNHSIRGFISTAGKRYGVTIESSKNESGERLYRMAK